MTSPSGDLPKNPARKPKAAPKKVAPEQINDLAGFARAVLKGIGAPATPNNVNFIIAWAHHEGTAATANPLATTQKATGSVVLPGNPSGVQQYGSYAQGVQATVATLTNGLYGDLINAFRSGTADVNKTYAGLKRWSLAADGSYYDNLAGQSTQNVKLSAPKAGTGATYTGGKATPTTDSVTATARSTYGYLSGFLDDPVIGPILKQAAAQNLDNSQLLGLIYKDPAAHQWWNTHSDSSRQFDAEAQLDKAAHQQKIANQANAVQTLARQDGFGLDPTRANKIAADSLRYNWSNDQVKQAVANEYHYDPNGQANAVVAQLKQAATDYLVPLSDSTIQDWARKVMAGTVTIGNAASPGQFDSYLREQAKSLFPSLSNAIDQGITVQRYVDPYRQLASQTLGINADSINFTDPKWMAAINVIDPKTNQRSSLSLSDWVTKMKTDPTYGYDHTQAANNDQSQLLSQLRSGLGV